jgi:hypothetical protein
LIIDYNLMWVDGILLPYLGEETVWILLAEPHASGNVF